MPAMSKAQQIETSTEEQLILTLDACLLASLSKCRAVKTVAMHCWLSFVLYSVYACSRISQGLEDHLEEALCARLLGDVTKCIQPQHLRATSTQRSKGLVYKLGAYKYSWVIHGLQRDDTWLAERWSLTGIYLGCSSSFQQPVPQEGKGWVCLWSKLKFVWEKYL